MLGLYYIWYFALLFDAVFDELEPMGEPKYRTKVDFARAWHSHLLYDDGEARDRIYDKVVGSIDQPSEYEDVSRKTANFLLHLIEE